MGQKFDDKTHKWVYVPEPNTPTATSSNNNSSGGTSTPQSSTKPAQSSTPAPTKADGKSKDANKEFTNQELTYLTGDCNVEPNSVTLSTQAGNTVELKNLGRHLSGLYFVTEVKIGISTSGVSLSYSVLKNGFGETLKPYVPIAETSEQGDTPIEVTTSVSVGDTIKFIDGVDAVYSNANDGVKVPAWVKEKTYTVQKLSDDGKRALLKEIVSWTYVEYLQKV